MDLRTAAVPAQRACLAPAGADSAPASHKGWAPVPHAPARAQAGAWHARGAAGGRGGARAVGGQPCAPVMRGGRRGRPAARPPPTACSAAPRSAAPRPGWTRASAARARSSALRGAPRPRVSADGTGRGPVSRGWAGDRGSPTRRAGAQGRLPQPAARHMPQGKARRSASLAPAAQPHPTHAPPA